MTMSVIRFDMRSPDKTSQELVSQYRGALEMATWADEAGLDMVVLSEHHVSPDSYLPSPLMMAAAVAAVTTRIPINISALLVALHNPVKLAEDLAVADVISNGRISFVAGIGYRPVEYEALGIEWAGRGTRMDESLEILLKAWRGEEFEWEGGTFTVTPRPVQEPHPLAFIGGAGPRAARRAARFGLGLFPSNADPELVEQYEAECAKLGTTPGMVLAPSADQPGSVLVAEDPDRAWAEIGPYLLHDAMIYKSWQASGSDSAVHSSATTLQELRDERVYQILTPDETVAVAELLGPFGALVFHPLCGGTPVDLAWPHLELLADKVLPRLKAL